MRTSLLMNGINVAGNAVLVYGAGMGAEGVAIPTLISRAVAAVSSMWIFRVGFGILLGKVAGLGVFGVWSGEGFRPVRANRREGSQYGLSSA